MSKKLFVGGLSWDTTEASLSQAFAEVGPVSETKILLDRDTGRSRGFGFVTFHEAADADTAIRTLDGLDLDGRRIRVSEAQERGDGGFSGGRGGRGGRR